MSIFKLIFRHPTILARNLYFHRDHNHFYVTSDDITLFYIDTKFASAY